jgi:hypothetical protein
MQLLVGEKIVLERLVHLIRDELLEDALLIWTKVAPELSVGHLSPKAGLQNFAERLEAERQSVCKRPVKVEDDTLEGHPCLLVCDGGELRTALVLPSTSIRTPAPGSFGNKKDGPTMA